MTGVLNIANAAAGGLVVLLMIAALQVPYVQTDKTNTAATEPERHGVVLAGLVGLSPPKDGKTVGLGIWVHTSVEATGVRQPGETEPSDYYNNYAQAMCGTSGLAQPVSGSACKWALFNRCRSNQMFSIVGLLSTVLGSLASLSTFRGGAHAMHATGFYVLSSISYLVIFSLIAKTVGGTKASVDAFPGLQAISGSDAKFTAGAGCGFGGEFDYGPAFGLIVFCWIVASVQVVLGAMAFLGVGGSDTGGKSSLTQSDPA